MKKTIVLCAGLCTALAFTSCGSSESAYKKAYEKAKAQEQSQLITEQSPVNTPEVVSLVEKPVTQTTVVDNTDNAVVRTEDVTLVNGSGLSAFSVVVGSYSLKANAEGQQSKLKAAGYDAQIVYNSARNMYRVVASTYASKADAVRSRDQLRATYADAWLLYKK